MSPCELNAVITAITNYLYVTLPRKEYKDVAIFLSLLSKHLFSVLTIKELLDKGEEQIVLADVVE